MMSDAAKRSRVELVLLAIGCVAVFGWLFGHVLNFRGELYWSRWIIGVSIGSVIGAILGLSAISIARDLRQRK